MVVFPSMFEFTSRKFHSPLPIACIALGLILTTIYDPTCALSDSTPARIVKLTDSIQGLTTTLDKLVDIELNGDDNVFFAGALLGSPLSCTNCTLIIPPDRHGNKSVCFYQDAGNICQSFVCDTPPSSVSVVLSEEFDTFSIGFTAVIYSGVLGNDGSCGGLGNVSSHNFTYSVGKLKVDLSLVKTSVQEKDLKPTLSDLGCSKCVDGVISVPRLLYENTFARVLRVDLASPTGETDTFSVEKVRLEVCAYEPPSTSCGDIDYEELWEEVPPSLFPQIFNTIPPQSNSFNIAVARSSIFGALEDSPSGSLVDYRVTVEATDSSGALQTGEGILSDSGEHPLALWRAPTGLPRYGQCRVDIGGDDWAAKKAYKWIEDHPALVTRINDISGEHGRNIGHIEHKEGMDIDFMFKGLLDDQPDCEGYGLDGITGGEQYDALASLVAYAVVGDTTAVPEIKAWVDDQRKYIEDLLKADVERVIFGCGKEIVGGQGFPNLPRTWMRQLVTSGSLVDKDCGCGNTGSCIGNTLLNVDGGSSNIRSLMNTKVRFNNKHWNHIHVDLKK